MKKTISVILLIVMLLMSSIAVMGYSIDDAYTEFSGKYPEFTKSLSDGGIPNDVVKAFLSDIRDYMAEMNSYNAITRDNFDKAALDAVNTVSAREKYLDLQDALIKLYPDAIKQAIIYSTVPDEFKPLFETIKTIVFDHNMLDSSFNPPSGGTGTGAGSDKDGSVVSYIKTLSETVKAGSSYILPKTLIAVTQTNNEITATVSWDGKVNVSKPGTFTVHGVLTLPGGYTFAENMTNGIDYTVYVTEKLSDISFYDISPEYWAYEPIINLAENFILNGYLDGRFRPEESITRGEFAKIIVSATNCFDYSATMPFTDVNADKWYAPYIASAYKAGLIDGYPDGSFAPEAKITRADICLIVFRTMKKSAHPTVEAFADHTQIPEYAREAVYALTADGILNGMGDNNFAPRANATRAQTAKIVYKAFYGKD